MRTAIETCPVDCIHYVDWPELMRLEKEREGIDINFKAKLVGNDHDNAVNGMQVCTHVSIGDDQDTRSPRQDQRANALNARIQGV